MQSEALPLFALLLTGCVAAEWSKPGADEARVLEDQAGCHSVAQQKIERLWGPLLPVSIADLFINSNFGPSLAERQLLKRQAEEQCMRAKGYALSPMRN